MKLYFCSQIMRMNQTEYMESLIRDFPNMILNMLSQLSTSTIQKSSKTYNAVLIAGQGGSGIGGSFAAEILAKETTTPIVVCKSYQLPSFVSSNSLVIICSYSGNTEEALEIFEHAVKTGAQILTITAGGKLQELAAANNIECLLIPGGQPPRASMGLSLTALMFALAAKGIAKNEVISQFEKAASFLIDHEDAIIDESIEIAGALVGTIPILYATAEYEPVAVRWRQQINENSKMLCWHNTFPEMNHNELVGWAQDYEDVAVILFRSEDDHVRNQKRMDICKPIFERLSKEVIEIHAKGSNYIERALYLVLIGDWVSLELAKIEDLDPVEVNVINYLKGALND